MKIYFCRKCNYSGNRQMVRKHLREEHFIKGKSIVSKTLEKVYGKKKMSSITMNTLAVEVGS